MRKEIFLAIFAGIFFGLIVAFGVWKANDSINKSAYSTESETEDSTLTQLPETVDSDLSVIKPVNNQVLSTNTTIVSGISSNAKIISINTQSKDYVVEVDGSGEFEKEITLKPGINVINVSSFDQNNKRVYSNVLVVYSEKFADNTIEESPNATDEDSIRDKVQMKVDEAMKNPLAYIGTVTDISENTIQLNRFSFGDGQGNEIELVSVGEETEFSDIKNSPKDIELTDVAIGDFVAALGYKNGKEVLEAKRVLIDNKPTSVTFIPHVGMVTKNSNKIITIDSSGTSFDLKFAKTWEGPEINEVNVDDTVLAVGEVNNGVIENIRTLYVF